MRKNNWIVAAVAVVGCAVLLWAWFALGFNHVDDPVDMAVAVVWWVVVAVVIAAIVRAESRRREKMRLSFVGDGVVYNPERGLVPVEAGQHEVACLQRVLSGMVYPDEVRALSDAGNRPAFKWVVRSKRFSDYGDVWEGEVVSARDPEGRAVPFSDRDELVRLLGLAA